MGSPDVEVVGRRIGAGVIDVLILGFAFTLVQAVAGKAPTGGSASVRVEGTSALVLLGIVLLYYFISEATTGQTLGKRAMGVHVVGQDGTPCGTRRAFVRTLLRIIDSLPLLYMVGLAVIWGTKRRQRLGDLAAGTLVVRAPGRQPN